MPIALSKILEIPPLYKNQHSELKKLEYVVCSTILCTDGAPVFPQPSGVKIKYININVTNISYMRNVSEIVSTGSSQNLMLLAIFAACCAFVTESITRCLSTSSVPMKYPSCRGLPCVPSGNVIRP